MNRRTRLLMRVGLLVIPLASAVALVVIARDASYSKSWWAWLPLRDAPVTLLSCGRQDSRTAVSYGSALIDPFATAAVVLLAVALVASVGLPRIARLLTRVVVATFVVQVGVFADAWLGRAVVGRSGFDQDPYCNDTLQVVQTISRDAYLDTTRLLGVSLLLLMVLEIDVARSRSTRPREPARSQRFGSAVVWVLKTLLLASAACAFGRALYLAPSPVVVLEVGGLMVLTTVAALPVALVARPVARAVGWASWLVGAGLAFSIWCSTWAFSRDHERSEDYRSGGQGFQTFSDLLHDQLVRLLKVQEFFVWWFLGLVAIGVLGAILERLLRPASTSSQEPVEELCIKSTKLRRTAVEPPGAASRASEDRMAGSAGWE